MVRSRVALALAFALAAGGSAQAVDITAAVSGGNAGMPVSDVDGPVNSGQVLAEAIIPSDSFNNMEARAALDVDGNAAVALDGVYFVTGKPHVAGTPFPQVTDGVTTWSSTITNNSAEPKSYLYSFLLSPFRLLIGTIIGFSDTDPLAPAASFSVEVRANNVLVFESHALLRGGYFGHVLIESGTDLGGVHSFNEGAIWYDFAQFQGATSAGSAGPGESITVEAKLIAHTEAHVENSGGRVTMGDPLDLKDDPSVTAVFFEEDGPVGVEPASWSSAKQLYR